MTDPSSLPPRRADSPKNWRNWTGPALFSYGFRPFFLSAGVFGLLSVALWLPMWEGHFQLPSAFSPVDWHAHELLFGYLSAAIAGFLLTAIPNWTGRLPIAGPGLAALWALWIAGRIAVAASASLGAGAAIVDVGFLVAFAALALREIAAGKNWRNLRVVGLVLFIALANAIFHWEAATRGGAAYGKRMGVAGVVLLVSLIGGRIVPSFTRNFLARRGEGRLPAPFDRLDAATIGLSGLALGVWIALPEAFVTALLFALAACAQGVRLVRWAPERSGAEPLVWVLHLAYAFVPVGFALGALAIFAPNALAPSAALHVWTIGVVGLMTMAVMTRATRGHAGYPLQADRLTTLAYALLPISAAARVAAGAWPAASFALFHVAALAWIAAMALFSYVHWPMLTRARRALR